MKIIFEVKNVFSNAIMIDLWSKNIFFEHSSQKSLWDPNGTQSLGSLLVPWSDLSIILGKNKSIFFFEHLYGEIRCESLRIFFQPFFSYNKSAFCLGQNFLKIAQNCQKIKLLSFTLVKNSLYFFFRF
jgi:hypothetical protein